MPPANEILASSQRRSAALLFHSSTLQCALGKRFRMSASLPPSCTPFASNAANAGPAANSRIAKLVFRIQPLPAKAAHLMIVHHADRLHEGIHDRRADELETALLQVLRQRVGYFGTRRDVAPSAPATLDRLAVDEGPKIARKAAELLPQRDEGARVDDCCIDLGAVAHDA